MKKYTAPVAAFAAATLLTACLVPEKFSASVKFANDGSYSYKYEGLTAYYPAVLQIQSTGKSLSAKDEDSLRLEAQKMSKSQDVKSSEYVGNGRYQLAIAGNRKPGQAASVLDAFKVYTDKDGIINISSIGLKPKEKEELQKLGLKIEGKLEVILPRNAEVISSNATSTPSFMGLFGNYGWKIGSIEERPMMKIRLR